MIKNLRGAVVLGCLLALVSGCGGGDSTSTPTTPSATVDVTGTWVLSDRTISVTWKLTQSGSTVTGTSLQADSLNPEYGADGIPGVVTGTFAGGTFTYVDTYAATKLPGCKETDSGSLQVTGTVMSGRNTGNNACETPATSSSTVTFTKQ